jgi:DNA-binding transcriptional regulator YiaG
VTDAEFRKLRRLAGLTQEQTARVLEVTTRTVMRWEHGETKLGPLRSQAIRVRLLEEMFGHSLRTDSET